MDLEYFHSRGDCDFGDCGAGAEHAASLATRSHPHCRGPIDAVHDLVGRIVGDLQCDLMPSRDAVSSADYRLASAKVEVAQLQDLWDTSEVVAPYLPFAGTRIVEN